MPNRSATSRSPPPDLLSPKVGGPSVKPYQPEGIWEAVAMPQSNTRTYRQDSGEALYRRSLYTMWKRTAAPPSMEILNAPTRETFCVRAIAPTRRCRRSSLLNDPQFVEASRELAANALKASARISTRAWISSPCASTAGPSTRTNARSPENHSMPRWRPTASSRRTP